MEEKNLGLNYFDAILYINLAHRKDRKKRLLQGLSRLEVEKKKIHRIEATYDPLNGHRGCADSHRKAIDFAIKNNWQRVLVLEDDCVFLKKEWVEKSVENLQGLKGEWDVFFLGARLLQTKPSSFPDVLRVEEAQCSHAYALQSHYMPRLKSCFLESCHLLKEDYFFFQSAAFVLDQLWKPLQKIDRWFASKKLVAKQGRSFSDICYEELAKKW